MKRVYRYIVTGLISGLLLASSGWAAPGSGMGQYASDQPIEITADRLEGNDQAGRATFSGAVVARQGNVTIYAGQLTVFYPAGQRDIDRVEAYGAVRIVQGEKVATGEKAVFFNKEGRVVLSGNPKVHQGQDFVQGEEITVYLNEERSVVTGGSGGRVNATFHPQGGGK